MRRDVPRTGRWAATLLLAALLLPLLSVSETRAAALVVSTTNDSGPGSLRGAITQANAAPGSTITFAIPGPGAKMIALSSALPHLAANLTIDGMSQPTYSGTPVVAVDGGNAVTAFTVDSGATVRLRGLTVQHGRGASGGGILNHGTLTLDLSVVDGNSATTSGGIYNGGTLALLGSVVSNNSAASGAGIFSAGPLTVSASTINNTTASGLGGGLLTAGSAQQDITNSTLFGNSGSAGGGVDKQGKLAVGNSAISKNRATGTDGGGIKAEPQGSGISLVNTIVAVNSATGSGADVAGTFASGGANLIDTSTGSIGFTDVGSGGADHTCTDTSRLDPGIASALADNGGPIKTLALQTGVAVGSGDPATCADASVNNLDLRGLARPNACSIGAVEQRGIQSITVTPASPTVALGATQQFTAIATLTGTSTLDATSAVVWSSSDPSKATIVTGFTAATPGIATTTGTGAPTISARFGGVSGTAHAPRITRPQ